VPVPSNEEQSAVYTVPEVARRWKVSRHTVTAAINGGRLDAFKAGERQWRIRREEVLRFEREYMAKVAS
jgi:excisionase family DNA binding protein